jgi:hypothetical protein
MKKALKIRLLCTIIISIIMTSCEKKAEESYPDSQGFNVTVTEINTNLKIPNAKIVATKDAPRSGITDADGVCNFFGIKHGTYSVDVSADGYIPEINKSITIEKGEKRTLPIQLTKELSFNSSLNFSSSNQLSKPVYFKNNYKNKELTISIKIPDDDANWIKLGGSSEITLKPGEEKDVTFIIIPGGKTGTPDDSKIIINSNTSTGSSYLYITMFIPNPQAPVVATYDVNGITQNTADVTGNILNAGGGQISERGFYWSENPVINLQTDKSIKKGGGKVGEFSETLESLEKGKIYYVRAFATNSFGLGLGDVKKFTTSNTPTKPTTLVDFKNIFTDRISLVGKITSDGGGKISEYGFVWSLNGEPKITDNKVQITKMDAGNAFSGEITDLKPETEYKIRAYAINDIGSDNIGYSPTISIKTLVPDLSPKLNSFTPESSIFGETITINGVNFGTDTSKIRVLFSNNKRASIVSLTNTQIKTIVPLGAVTGPIKIQLTGQPIAESARSFTYVLTPYVNTIANIPTTYFINDASRVCNGNIFFSAVNINFSASKPYPINNTGIFRLNRDNSVSTLINSVAGNQDGGTNVAKFINPTEITCVNNDVYIADQYDSGVYKSNAPASYSNIRKLSGDNVSTTFTNTLTTNEFIHEFTYMPQLNGILYTNGTFYRYNLVDKPAVALNYDGLTTAMDTDGNDIYTLDLFPENNPTKWTLNKRKSTVLSSTEEISTQVLITPNVYPVGMALDAKRGFVYIVERNKKNNFNIYRIRLNTKKVEIIYDGSETSSQTDNSLEKGAKFTSISCIAFDTTRDALIIVDADSRSRNNVRVLEYK